MNRTLANVLFLALFIIGSCLVFWLRRHYSTKGDTLNPGAACALVAAIGLLVGASFQFVSSWRSASGSTHRQNAAHR